MRNSARQASFYDPKTKQFTLIDTCYSTHHLQFDNDPDETVYFNELSGPIFGWIDTKVYDETHDEQKAVGWCGQVLDTNGDGKITKPCQVAANAGAQVMPRFSIRPIPPPAETSSAGGGRGRGAAPTGSPEADPKLDTMVSYNLYSIIPSPVDDSVWGVSESSTRDARSACSAANNPPSTCKTHALQGARTGLRSARRRHRQQRRGLDGSGRHQPPGQLRRAQVQGPERPGEGRRQPVQGRLDALSDRPVRS